MNYSFGMTWSLLIKHLIQNGLTEAAIAERLGISQPSVHRLKTGETKEPKYSAGVQLCQMLEAHGRGKTSGVNPNY